MKKLQFLIILLALSFYSTVVFSQEKEMITVNGAKVIKDEVIVKFKSPEEKVGLKKIA